MFMHECVTHCSPPQYLEPLCLLQRIDGNRIYFLELALKPHYQPLRGGDPREKARQPSDGWGGESG